MRATEGGRQVIDLRADTAPRLRQGLDHEPFTTAHGKRVVVVGVAVLAVLVDAFTAIPHSWIVVAWAVLAAAIAVVPRVASLTMPVIAYAGVWIGFNMMRAWADGTPWADQRLGFVAWLERSLFGGTLPSAVMQEQAFDRVPNWYDYGWAAVYLSFFIVPHLVAILLLWWCRSLFWRYVLALAVLFALALAGFFALPTAPPWLVTEVVPAADFAHIVRVAPIAATHLGLPVQLYHQGLRGSVVVSQVRIEPNPMAAMPSIHFAATALLLFPAWHLHRRLGLLALVYTLLMGAALVYLGEHYILDLIVGGLFAAISWIVAARVLDRTQNGSNP